MRYDIAIVGSGPAGLSAAVNAKIRNKKIILFGNENLSNKLQKAPEINNYLGFYEISGEELKDKFKNHVDSLGIEITNHKITNIYAMGDYFALISGENMFEATTVILATGIQYGKPIKGEEEYLGRGVGYCATCDAPLYSGKDVVIVSSNEEGERDANYVSELAKRVYYVPLYNGEYRIKNNIEVVKDKPMEIIGDDKVKKILLKSNKIDTDGVFFLKDAISPSQLVPGLLEIDGHIMVDNHMRTNLKGCFAAGDCVGKPYQYIKAAGEGNIASLSAVAYLDGR